MSWGLSLPDGPGQAACSGPPSLPAHLQGTTPARGRAGSQQALDSERTDDSTVTPLPSLARGCGSPRRARRERWVANLSLGPWCAAPAGRGRSSGGCPRAVHSRSRPSRRPTPATAPTPPPGWTRGPAPHGPLQRHSGGTGWARAPRPGHPTAALHAAGHLRDPRLDSSAASGQLQRGPHHLRDVPELLQVHLSAGKHTEPLLNSLWHGTRGFYRLLLRNQLKAAEGPCPSSPSLPSH